MKASEIQIGGLYKAKVSNKITTVKVLNIRENEIRRHAGYNYGGQPIYRSSNRTVYDVLNVNTNRKTTFKSAQKFRSKVK